MKYIIGDVHGCYKSLLALINKLPENAEIIFVGDLIDRGPDSAKVVEFIKKNNYDCVLGNHEKMMIEYVSLAIAFPERYNHWIDCGGINTIKSYGSDLNLLEEHIKWMLTLPLYLEYKDIKDEKNRHLLVTHTSVVDFFNIYLNLKKTNNIELLSKYEEAMIWARSIPTKDNNQFFNVFGHTPIEPMKTKMLSEEQKNKWSYENILLSKEIGFANVDTGCVYKKELTALEFPSLKVIKQENID